MKVKLLVVFIGIIIPHVAFANLQAKVEVFLQKQVTKTDAPSLSVAAGHNGKLMVAAAVGVADKSNNKAATVNTQYRTGSVSKVIGVTGLMPLIEQGKVTIDDKIHNYLPYLPKHYKDIQLKHLLTHTSGIRHYRFGEYGTNTHYPKLKTATKVFRNDALEFQPGTGYVYSTYGINLIQGVIEQVSGLSLSEYMQTNLFRPLNMRHTELEQKGNDDKLYAIGYRSLFSSHPVHEIDVSNKYIGGGMRTTPTDLVTMVQAISSGKIMSASTKKLMLDVPFPKVAADRALGWRWMEYKGRKGFAHGGAINGFESFLVHFVDEDVTVAVMVNQDDYDHTSSTLYKVLELTRAEIAKQNQS